MTAHEAAVPVTTIEQLVAYFRAGGKPVAAFRLGVEQEKLPVREDGAPVSYAAPAGGVAVLLDALLAAGFHAEREGDRVVGLRRGEDRVTLEPGGQVEHSGAALPTATACAAALDAQTREVTAAARALGIRFVAAGFRPWGTLDDVTWLPKRRYDIMRAYLPGRGRLAHEMMKRTATVQVNLDYRDEADAADKLRVAYGLTSVVTALCAASPIVEGRPNGQQSYRAAVWLDTDEDRCGIPACVFAPGFGFASYVEWALDVPMFFVVRDGQYLPAPAGLTFRRYWREGFAGAAATLDDFERHLSTLFPEVRLKRFIEVRGADAGPLPMQRALGALWRGVLYDDDARRAAWELVRNASMGDRLTLRRDVPRAGLRARLGDAPIVEVARALVEIADAGLRRLPGGQDDRTLLEPMRERARAGRSPADDMLDDWRRLGGDPRRLVEAWALERDLERDL